MTGINRHYWLMYNNRTGNVETYSHKRRTINMSGDGFLSGSLTLASAASSGSSTLTIETPSYSLRSGYFWVILSPFTSSCEVKKVISQVAGETLTLESVLENTHTSGSSIYWTVDSEVNVMWFGAVGDGVTDDSSAIQAAIDAAASTVVFPEGEYLCESSINVTERKKITFFGYGASVVSKATSWPAFDMAGAERCIVEGLTVEGDEDNKPFCAFLLTRTVDKVNASYCRFINATVTGYFEHACWVTVCAEGVELLGCDAIGITAPYVYYCGSNAAGINSAKTIRDYSTHGIAYVGGVLHRIERCFFNLKYGTDHTAAIRISQGYGQFSVKDCYASVWADGSAFLDIDYEDFGEGSNAALSTRLEGVVTEGVGEVFLRLGEGAASKNLHMINCAGAPVMVSGADNSEFVSPTINHLFPGASGTTPIDVYDMSFGNLDNWWVDSGADILIRNDGTNNVCSAYTGTMEIQGTSLMNVVRRVKATEGNRPAINIFDGGLAFSYDTGSSLEWHRSAVVTTSGESIPSYGMVTVNTTLSGARSGDIASVSPVGRPSEDISWCTVPYEDSVQLRLSSSVSGTLNLDSIDWTIDVRRYK